MMIAVTLGFSGCKSNNGDKAQLTANEWQLKEMTTTKGKTALPQRVPTLMLTDTNTMYGFSGCNRFFGKYSTKGNTIKFEPGGSTMMACPDLQSEGEYMQTLATMTSYSIESKELKLTDKDRKQTLVFVPKTEEEIIGVANDAHGCNGAAGYTWSEARKDCIRLFESGVKMLEELCDIPVVGVVPYYKDIYIEEEDSVALEAKASAAVAGKINVAVIRLPRMSNFTDFNALERDGRFHLYYTDKAEEIGKADVIILPGTKSTIADLQAIYANGVAEAVVKAFRKKKKVIGICGGYQMMGVRIEDPGQVEGMQTATDGLGLLPLVTVMQDAKVVCQSHFRFKNYESDCAGYQIHMGTTTPLHAGGRQTTLNTLADGTTDGYRLNADCWGSYMHGILDNPVVLDDLAAGFGVTAGSGFDYRAFKERQYDLLAGQVRKAVDLDYIYSTLFL